MSALRNPHRRFCHRRSVCLGGFTLIELFVVIAIIAVLAALAFPLWGRMRASSMAATCTANLRTLHQATMHFAADNNGFFPVAKTPRAAELWVLKLAGTLHPTRRDISACLVRRRCSVRLLWSS
jgi:prepilin-type N-terminal cleavage/methylation domain-containing protein